MKRLLYLLTAILLIASCGPSYEEKRRQSHKRRMQLLREDSAALKVAVMPTLDCLPLFVAKEGHIFDSLGTDVRLKMFTAQMDCDTALVGGSVEGAVTDLVRAARIEQQGTPLLYVFATDAYWQLYSNSMARIKRLPQLDDKMIGMTRYSATALMADAVTDSAKLQHDRVFKIQVNDVFIRLKMLQMGEIDAALLSEPQASVARETKQFLLADTRKDSICLGVIAFREKPLKDEARQRQLEVFKKGYSQACDSLARYGVNRYRHLIVKYCKIKESQIDSTLLHSMKFLPITAPREADIERARQWLQKQ